MLNIILIERDFNFKWNKDVKYLYVRVTLDIVYIYISWSRLLTWKRVISIRRKDARLYIYNFLKIFMCKWFNSVCILFDTISNCLISSFPYICIHIRMNVFQDTYELTELELESYIIFFTIFISKNNQYRIILVIYNINTWLLIPFIQHVLYAG